MKDKTIVKKKSPIFAVIASFIFTGLGQIYNGELRKGIGFIIIGIIFASIWVFLTQSGHIIGPILVSSAGYLLLWVSTIHDAYKTAEKINSHLLLLSDT